MFVNKLAPIARRYATDSNVSRMSFEKTLTNEEITKQLTGMFNILSHMKSNKKYKTQDLISDVGFYCYKSKSSIEGAGFGVFSRCDTFIPKGSVVSIYSGTVYANYEPTFLPSIGNKFILQRKDGFLIDGNDRYMSKIIYKSCKTRERYYDTRESKHVELCDDSWLQFRHQTSHQDFCNNSVLNPYAIGHYINSSHENHKNQTQEANVMYFEYEFDRDEWPDDLLQFIPNVHYSTQTMYLRANKCGLIKSIVLVALRDILNGEELFACYKNLVYT
ncbi:SET domain-containing protein [Acrasis kona]|uniref:SET domain-containing protein n=1 Tax=Acrasis kona TaxID=1008807 RepID=A0AAW2ZEI2_9EUKA